MHVETQSSPTTGFMDPLASADAQLSIGFYTNLISWPKRSSGGVRQWVLTMANALAARGHQVDLLCETPAWKFVDEPLLDPRVNRIILGIGFLARMRLWRYVQNHPGVRIVSALNHYNLEAARLKARFGSRVHVTLTQRENLSADAEWRRPHKYRALKSAVQTHFNRADAVVTVSNGLAKDLHDNFGVRPDKLHTIYNPAYRPDFVTAATESVDHPWFGRKNKPVIIAAGRLHSVKGFADLLRAFKHVRNQCDARLIILGEGKERHNLEHLVQELELSGSVQLPGRVPSTAPWFARSDLFVLSSRREGLPAVLIEALAVGMRVVATDCPSGPHEILEGGRWGRLVAVGNVEALAQAIIDALREASHNREASQARAAEFSLTRALQAYLQLWHSPPSP
ncbi:MAG TPA: glycosyltransferase [Paraburkholderia sp.]|uniref:glycosyltransferase n=1 Tax=Paraburkholderia sp. TaxID=1926495 RepID=UPI002B49F30C|nr:glycosyltransferase [Paraburkholderia sp.]HKR46509.1 glycosyltransferase [Paraburkholderia sp.]